MLKPTRRVVTGIDSSKQSTLISDETINTLIPYPEYQSFQLQDLFYTEQNPQSLATRPLNKPYNIEVPEGGMRFIKIRMPTKIEMSEELKAAGQPIPDDWTTFNLHATDSVDYIYILSGSVTCVVGTQTTQLNAGDFLVQVGPEHTWINDTAEPCYLLCIMMGTKPNPEHKKMTLE